MENPKKSEELEEVIAKALHKHALDQTHKLIGGCDMQLDRIRGCFERSRAEADRSAAILLFALAEDMMLLCFKAHLNHSVPGGWNSVTGGNGVLATASDRLTMMELLSWVRSSIAADLRLMKSIRNRFAHHADVESFQDKKICGWITSMNATERRIMAVWEEEGKAIPAQTTRDTYLTRAIAAVIGLACDIAMRPISRQQRVSPYDIGNGKFENMPENVRAAFRLQAELVSSVWGFVEEDSPKK